MVELIKVQENELEFLREMQIKAFAELLEKYQDYDGNPGAESMEKIRKRFNHPNGTYFFITDNNVKVGVIHIYVRADGWKRVSPIFVDPAFRNKGYAQKAMLLAEEIFGKDHWSLDTVKEEKQLCYLYEKMGYHQTNKETKVSDIQTLIVYEKD